MTNPMLAELDEVVRLSERATPGKVELHTSCSWRRIVAERGRPFLVPTIDPDRHQNMDTTESAEFVVALVNWFRTHHATLADMAKRMEAAERDAARYRHIRLRLWPSDVQDALSSYPAEIRGLDMTVCNGHAEQIDAAIDATQEGEG